jgi:hypothetical protein
MTSPIVGMSLASFVGFAVVSAAIVGMAGYLTVTRFTPLKSVIVVGWRDFRAEESQLVDPSPMFTAVFVTASVLIAAVVFGYSGWAQWSIGKQFVAGDILFADKNQGWTENKVVNLPNFALRDVSVLVGNCSPNHFWGHMVYYREDDTQLPREHYVHAGRACRDWVNGRWVLVRDVPYGWRRYWK